MKFLILISERITQENAVRMAGRGRNDVVTIIYPPGCREVNK